jgi:aconitate hydratase
MNASARNSFGARSALHTAGGPVIVFRLSKLQEAGIASIERLPFSIKILLENLLRNEDGHTITMEDVEALARWDSRTSAQQEVAEVAFMPARVLLQDFTGVPSVVDLAAMREALRRLGGNPRSINPRCPADLIIDHSVQVDRFGSSTALAFNAEKEFERNRERYALLRWAQKSFEDFTVVPPATGICHQVNLEYISRVVFTRREENGGMLAFPDTLVGTDSHTTMINGIGVLGWGVGGIEAEAVMLGQPYTMLTPGVLGFRLSGRLPAESTATDLVLTVTQMLRKRGVVSMFVEFFGPGLASLSVADRATIANMAPEYGATMGFFPVDGETLEYLRFTGRSAEQVALVEAYCKEQGLFYTGDGPEPRFTDTLELDMTRIEPSLAGPKRPQERVPLGTMKAAFLEALKTTYGRTSPQSRKHDEEHMRWHEEGGSVGVLEPAGDQEEKSPAECDEIEVEMNDLRFTLNHGSVVISAITSCTNTSNPSVMIAAGLLAKKAVERGLSVRPWVKTSLAPGSKVVSSYLQASGLLPYLEALRFHLVGFGCTTCIGNSGPLPPAIAEAIKKNDLVVAAVLSGTRNFEGRINPLTRANYLCSPPLVVAYALAGRIDLDILKEPLGHDANGEPVFLKDLWPTREEIDDVIRSAVKPEMFRQQYSDVYEGSTEWKSLSIPEGDLFDWDPRSSYIREPAFFENMTLEASPLTNIENARVLLMLGDTVTTDHISPAGTIPAESPAGLYLIGKGVRPPDFNSYGSRRGNHEVMVRGTFANIRLRNQLVPGVEGGWTVHFPDGERRTVFDAAVRYEKEGVPLLVIAGKEYGAGSSRDWAAKGTMLLGIRAVLAESFERIHRSNLVGMGVLPLQFLPVENPEALGLTGKEVYTILGIDGGLSPRQSLAVKARREDGGTIEFEVIARIDSPVEAEYFRNGGILQAVLRKMAPAG